MAQKMSTQTKQLWRQFTRVNHDKMDSLWLICIVLLEEAFRPPLVEFDKSWLVFFFCVKTLRVPHVLLHCQQGKVRWQTVETSRDHHVTVPVRRIQRNSHCSQLSLVLSCSLSWSFSSKIVAAPQAAAARLATRSCLKAMCRLLCQSAARLTDGYDSQICLGLCSPVRSWCVTFSVCKQILQLHLWWRCEEGLVYTVWVKSWAQCLCYILFFVSMLWWSDMFILLLQ